MKELLENKVVNIIFKIILTIISFILSFYVGFVGSLTLAFDDINSILSMLFWIILPSLLVPIIWLPSKKIRKTYIKYYFLGLIIYLSSLGINYGMIMYEKSLKIDTTPNIKEEEYLPFKEDSKIVKLDSKTLKLTENLPILDGATAVFPVYSAFIHAVYPETTTLHDGVFEYHNTKGGYYNLAMKNVDIFFGAYPSNRQIEYAEEQGTEFKYTPIGSEAFVFFVNKKNPIDNLTKEQIQKIYSGEITNWKELGGKDEEITAFQRDEGSGSQSMLIRFMDGKELMTPPKEEINDLMLGIIEQVSDYRNYSNSIGFSFRYYVDGIIKNPNIKMISVDGVFPSVENIKNGSYPITTDLYAVTYEGNPNENVDKLIEWILSEEGQYIIEQTGYAGIN